MSRVIGKCGLCGGRVTVPDVWMGTTPPEPTCESCHAVAVSSEPALPMMPRGNYEASKSYRQEHISAAEQLRRFGRGGNQ